MSTRRVLLLGALIVLVACTSKAQAANNSTGITDVILVHGAWADASMWSSVIGNLQSKGIQVHAPQLYLRSVQEDVSVVKRAIAAVAGPVVVAAHSVGGFIASLATAGETNVTAIVYIAAYAPDINDTILSLATKFGPPAFAQHLVIDERGFSTIDTEGYVKTFALGVKAAQARILSVVQKPTAASMFGFNATTPGWRTIPSYFQISTKDGAVSPQLQAFEAERMKAVEVVKLNTGHLSLITQPKQVSALIMRACAAEANRTAHARSSL